MVKTAWDIGKLITAASRDAGRIHDSADFLTPIERDTFVRVFEMFAWIIHDRQPSLGQRQLPPLSDEELQPLRDWMKEIGGKRHAFQKQFDVPNLIFPSFNERTGKEKTGKVVGITHAYDPDFQIAPRRRQWPNGRSTAMAGTRRSGT